MKNSLLITLSLLFILNSCIKNEEATPVLNIDENQSVIELSLTNSSTTLNLTSNINWQIKCDQKWCTLSDSAGNSNKSIVVSCADNFTGSNRNAKLTIEGGGLSQSVIVSQTGGHTLLEDNFTANINNWPTRSDSIAYKIQNGYFNFKNTCKVYSWSFAPKECLSNTLDSFVVNIVYSRVSGVGVFGISIGGSDWNNLYRVFLYNDSYYVLNRLEGVYTLLIPRTTCSLNSTGNNSLRLVRMNDKCDIYINDIMVNSFTINPYGGIIGFFLSTQTEINVDYMKVTKI